MHVCAPLRRLGRDFGVTLGLDLPIRGGTRLPMRDRDSRKRNQTCRHGALVLLDSRTAKSNRTNRALNHATHRALGVHARLWLCVRGFLPGATPTAIWLCAGSVECKGTREVIPFMSVSPHAISASFRLGLGFRGFSVEIYTCRHVQHINV